MRSQANCLLQVADEQTILHASCNHDIQSLEIIYEFT